MYLTPTINQGDLSKVEMAIMDRCLGITKVEDHLLVLNIGMALEEPFFSMLP
jgi:hypothetical protein